MDRLICNKCGKVLSVIRSIPHEDYVTICKKWGYFSKKDGKTQKFLLCEDCVELITQDFIIPALLEDTTEIL